MGFEYTYGTRIESDGGIGLDLGGNEAELLGLMIVLTFATGKEFVYNVIPLRKGTRGHLVK